MSRLEQYEEAIRAVIKALDVPRNRFGKLDGDGASREDLRELAVRYKVGGAQDSAHQAVLVFRHLLEQPDV